ncbi:TPA: hypothetical protein ACGSTL_001365 [Vibrio parahaemolyticus]|uniref:hypothetical protein n=1 Tax=Vibrio campbellii TaxID=680 RepID=UPI001F087E8C|nr:hypothetical protein [Vibrio campbellii]UMM06810.1 hypothetical protein MKR81_26480 [Vibrio campbellii]
MIVELMIVCITMGIIAICAFFKYPNFLKQFAGMLIVGGVITLGIAISKDPKDTEQIGYLVIVIGAGIVSALAAMVIKAYTVKKNGR